MSDKQKPGPKPKLVLDEKTLHTLRQLGAIQATVEEAARVLGVSERTLQNFFTAEPTAKDAHETGKSEGRASLRRSQFTLAQRNAAMAIWLGKQYLGQREPVNQTEIGRPGEFANLTEEEIDAAIVEQTRALAEADPDFAKAVRPTPAGKRATRH